jgi:hypothetical protein
VCFDSFEQRVEIVSSRSGDSDDYLRRKRGPGGNDPVEIFRFGEKIDFVHHKNTGSGNPLKDFPEKFLFRSPLGSSRVENQTNAIRIFNGIPCPLHHVLSQGVMGLVKTRRVHKDDLRPFGGENAA